MNILFIGDIFGNPGRQAVKRLLRGLMVKYETDLVVANCENSAGGKGVTEKIAEELFAAGVDALTGGNHIFYQRDSHDFIDREERLARPINYPPGAPGRGSIVVTAAGGQRVGIANACGRSFMGHHYDDPFRALDAAVADLSREAKVILVDFHAETTSEKMAMGWYLDGRVSAVFGTHTHIPTADERLLHRGTAYITDVGMTGPYDSVIGDDKGIILQSILTQRPTRFEVAEAREVRLCGAIVEVDGETGRALRIERVRADLD